MTNKKRETIETTGREVSENAPAPEPASGSESARKKRPTGPLKCTVRRRTAGGGWERCAVYDPATSRRVERFAADELGEGHQNVLAVWGGGVYEITRFRGRQIAGKSTVTFEAPPKSAYCKPPDPETEPEPEPDSDPEPAKQEFGEGFRQGLQMASEGFGMVISMMREARQTERQDHEQRLQTERVYAEERIRRERQDHEFAMKRFLAVSRQASGDDTEERLAALEQGGGADPDQWHPIVSEVVSGIKEAVGPLVAAAVMKQGGQGGGQG